MTTASIQKQAKLGPLRPEAWPKPRGHRRPFTSGTCSTFNCPLMYCGQTQAVWRAGPGRGRAGLRSTEERRLMEVGDPGEGAGEGFGCDGSSEQFLVHTPRVPSPTPPSLETKPGCMLPVNREVRTTQDPGSTRALDGSTPGTELGGGSQVLRQT